MADVEKVARAIPDEAVEAALVAWYAEHGRLRIEWPDGIPSPHRASRANGMRAAIEAALSAMGEREAKPVAWRVHDWADGWILFNNEARAKHEAENSTGVIQPLYASPRPEAVEDAVKAERERCARIAEADRRGELAKQCGYEPAFHTVGKVIAAAIRATEEPPAPTPLTPSIPDQR